jgi:glycosyltransferase involved in cell wall biosynthesis
MTRVLHVHSGNIFGGVESILLTLVRRRHLCPDLENVFALCFDDRLDRELREAGATVHRLGPVRVSRPWTIWRARSALRDLLRREPFDAVVMHSAWSYAIFAPTGRRAGLPVVWWLHNRAAGTHWSERWAKWTRPDLMICVSRSTAETHRRLFTEIDTEIIYAPIPVDRQELSAEERLAVRAELQTPSDSVVIIQVSRMEAWKGHEDHLRALQSMRDLANWTCWQVGGPHSVEESRYCDGLRRQAQELGIGERVRFLGQRSDVPRLLGAADLFCQPNRDTEGFSIAFMEAFQAGLPIITTAIGGAVEMVNDECGILLPVGAAAELTQSLQRLVIDEGLRRRLGAAGKDRVHELCAPARQLQKLKDALDGAVRRARGKGAEPRPAMAGSAM